MRRPTRPCAAATALALFLLAFGAGAQNPAKDLAQLLEQRVSHQQVILQNFSAAPLVQASLTTDGIAFKPSIERSFSLISFQKVSVNGERVILTGTKQYVLRSNGQLARSAETEPVRLEIVVDPSMTQAELAHVSENIFFANVKAALEAIPAGARKLVPTHAEPQNEPKQAPACDCTEGAIVCPLQPGRDGWNGLKIIQQPDPEIPAGAPRAVTAVTSSALEVDEKGEVATVWLLQAPSASFAAATLASVRAYLFTPATCHGRPVALFLQVDQQFTRY